MNHLSELASAEILELEEQGISLTLEQKIWINDLARQVENPDGSRPCTAIGEPIPVGSTWLWPFTIAGARWFGKMLPLFDGEPETEAFLLGFCLAHGREYGAFQKLTNYNVAKKAVLDWADTLDCTPDELSQAIAAILPSDGVPELEQIQEERKADVNYDDLIASLVLNVGETPDFWAHSVSSDYALFQLDMLRKQNEARCEAPDAHDPYIIATKNLGKAIIDIKREAKEFDG